MNKMTLGQTSFSFFLFFNFIFTTTYIKFSLSHGIIHVGILLPIYLYVHAFTTRRLALRYSQHDIRHYECCVCVSLFQVLHVKQISTSHSHTRHNKDQNNEKFITDTRATTRFIFFFFLSKNLLIQHMK